MRLPFCVLIATLICGCFAASGFSSSSDVRPIDITMSNWSSVLEGEWLIEFYAPWCPSCKSYAPIWEEFARKCPKRVKVARADVDANPELSGRLLIVSLPTIYHVKDGKFRQHEGSRNLEELIRHVNEKLFEEIYEPLSWVWHPQSPHMIILGFLFRIAVEIRNLQLFMTTTLGLPTWLSYVVLLLTLLICAIALGFIAVVVVDRIWYRGRDQDEQLPLRSPTPTSEEELEDDDDGYDDYHRKGKGRRRHRRRHSSDEDDEKDSDATTTSLSEDEVGDEEMGEIAAGDRELRKRKSGIEAA